MTHTTPEAEYRNATTAARRRSLQTAVVVAYRDRIAALVRRRFPAELRDEAAQVAAIGLLVALEKYDPDRGVPFWPFAVPWVRSELELWVGHGVRWRPSTKGAMGRRVAVESLIHAAFDAERHDRASEGDSVEDLVGNAEVLRLVSAFLAELPAEDRDLLLCEKRDRDGGGIVMGNNARSRRYLSLVERATAFVRGSEDNDGVRPDHDRGTVSRHPGPARVAAAPEARRATR